MTYAMASALKRLYPSYPVGEPAPKKAETWSMPLVWQFFKRFTLGDLLMVLPDGSKRRLGGQMFNPDVMSWPSLRAEMVVHDGRFFDCVVKSGDIGLAEAYMQGYWDSDNVAAVLCWFIVNTVHAYPKGDMGAVWQVNLARWVNRLQHRFRPNTVAGSQKNIESHYDLSNPFFQLFLDPTMAYSSGLFQDELDDLESAQHNKFEALCQKLRLRPHDHLLEIGSGWGGFAVYAASHYGCRVTTVTVSQAQYEGACQRIHQAEMDHKVDVKICDYRDLTGQYDKIVSVEMIEAVGDAYYDTFFAQCQQLLKPNGLLVLQMITCPDDRYQLVKSHVDFIQKHIFPGSLLPSLDRIHQSVRSTTDLFMHQLDDLGNSYARTLAIWDRNFLQQLASIELLGFDATFIRKWHYYLQYCEAAFATRNITVVQAVYTRANNPTLLEAFSWPA
jgi:cyclopropane-fatty-acyl-phospholipid synthase